MLPNMILYNAMEEKTPFPGPFCKTKYEYEKKEKTLMGAITVHAIDNFRIDTIRINTIQSIHIIQTIPSIRTSVGIGQSPD
jgi:hypothetical protein